MLVRKALRKTSDGLLAVPPVLAALRVAASRGVSVFMYHDIGGDQSPGDAWQVVRRSDFVRQIEYLRRFYDLVSLDEAVSRLAQTARASRPMAVITLDDGLKGNFEYLLPIIRHEAIPVVIYVATRQVQTQENYWFDKIVNSLQGEPPIKVDLQRFGLGTYVITHAKGSGKWASIQRVLQDVKALPDGVCAEVAVEVRRQTGTWHPETLAPLAPNELAELSHCDHVTIGAHTHGHEILTLLDPPSLGRTLSECRSLIKSWTGRDVRHFAYPSGVFDTNVETAVRDLGFQTAVTTRTGIWQRSDSLYRIPRVAVGRYDSMQRFKVAAALAGIANG